MEPKLKRKKGAFYRHKQPDSLLPVSKIQTAESDTKFIGHFNGLNVEIIDKDHINSIYKNGCFGISSITKAAPMTLWKDKKPARITQGLYDKKIEWRKNYINKDIPDDIDDDSVIKVETVSDTNSKNISTANATMEEKDETKTIVVDPFPLDESLMLSCEEAFFLHFTLKCLEIINKDGNPMKTEDLFQQFTSINSNFIRNFVAYQYLRSKNWIVKSGLKFGADFLLYKQGPRYYHASFAVIVVDQNDSANMSVNYMHGLYRTAENAKKDLLIVEVYYPKSLNLNSSDCLEKLSSFKISEYSPKRFNMNQNR